MTHQERAKKAGLATACTVHHITFGGGCLNCGYNLAVVRPLSKKGRKDNLRRHGFEIPGDRKKRLP